MGSFSIVDPISHRLVHEGDPVVALLICRSGVERHEFENPSSHKIDPTESFGICSLLLKGTYNGYANLDIADGSAALRLALHCYQKESWEKLSTDLLGSYEGKYGLFILHADTYATLCAALHWSDAATQTTQHLALVTQALAEHDRNPTAALDSESTLRTLTFDARLPASDTQPVPPLSSLLLDQPKLLETKLRRTIGTFNRNEFIAAIKTAPASQKAYQELTHSLADLQQLHEAMVCFGLQFTPIIAPRQYCDRLALLSGFLVDQIDAELKEIADMEEPDRATRALKKVMATLSGKIKQVEATLASSTTPACDR